MPFFVLFGQMFSSGLSDHFDVMCGKNFWFVAVHCFGSIGSEPNNTRFAPNVEQKTIKNFKIENRKFESNLSKWILSVSMNVVLVGLVSRAFTNSSEGLSISMVSSNSGDNILSVSTITCLLSWSTSIKTAPFSGYRWIYSSDPLSANWMTDQSLLKLCQS